MSSLLPDSLRDQDAPPRVLVEALREEPIEPGRIESAYARFLRQSEAAPARWRGPRVVRHGALAVLMAVGTVYAATHIRPLTGGPQPTEVRPSTETPKPPPKRVSPPQAAMALEDDVSPKQEPSAEPDMLPSVPPAPVATLREPSLRSPAPIPSAEQWKRAAQGLRDGDYERAEAALKALRRSGTEADRESALLVQAQVLLAQGRKAEAQTLLKSLEGSARAPSVRRKSAELLARLRDRPAPGSGKARATEAP